MGSWKARGNQYTQFVRVLYCKLPTNGKQLPAFPLEAVPAFPLEAVPGAEPWPQRWEATVLPLCHREPLQGFLDLYKCRQYFFVNSIRQGQTNSGNPILITTKPN